MSSGRRQAFMEFSNVTITKAKDEAVRVCKTVPRI